MIDIHFLSVSQTRQLRNHQKEPIIKPAFATMRCYDSDFRESFVNISKQRLTRMRDEIEKALAALDQIEELEGE